jgi:predicted nucleic acid-binding protein
LSVVLDSSVTLTWCFGDERTDATVAVLEHVTGNGAVAPSLWPLEVLNGLAMAERRQRLSAAQRETLAGFLASLPIRIDPDTAPQAWIATAHLAARYKLTLYDAAYLELAQRLSLPLASLDQELRTAASTLGIRLLGQ